MKFPIEEIKVRLDRELTLIQSLFDDYQKTCFTQRSPDFFCLELNGEAGELANIEKKILKGKDMPKALLEDEAADVFIALMNYCNAREIELGKAIAFKLSKIEKIRAELEERGEMY